MIDLLSKPPTQQINLTPLSFQELLKKTIEEEPIGNLESLTMAQMELLDSARFEHSAHSAFVQRFIELGKSIGSPQFGTPSLSSEPNLIFLKAENKELKSKLSTINNDYQALAFLAKHAYLTERISVEASKRMLGSNGALIAEMGLNSSTKSLEAFILSIDIRRSTDLMLNAKESTLFADFLNKLSNGLENIIKEQFGIFDKFTGDGALAFFPKPFSGTTAALNILIAAKKAHAFFKAHYDACRGSFSSVLLETGLGIGIDYGSVKILKLSDGLTVVGKPVVYACRFAGAGAGTTLVNQGAYEAMSALDNLLEFDEVSIDIKHQGKHLAYQPKNSPRIELIKEPEWLTSPSKPSE